jgi:hypothetical protein
LKPGGRPGGRPGFLVLGGGGPGFFTGGFLIPDGTDGISVTASPIYGSGGLGYYFSGSIGASTTVWEVIGSGMLGGAYWVYRGRDYF